MSSISLTPAIHNNLLSLKRLSSQMSKVQQVLSTGKRVNSALDNASNYYRAQSLTNRAADLMELLNDMDKGIRTIEAATTGLDAGAAFLEQATAVATQALAASKIPAKEWFEKQTGVAAVVSSWNELKAALDSGRQGNIVVYGNIECQDTISLRAGQNLVGVGYYGIEEPDTDKFSQLNFVKKLSSDALKTSDVLGSSNIIADMTIKGAVKGNFIRCLNQTMLSDLDIRYNMSESSSMITYGVINAIGENADVHLKDVFVQADQDDSAYVAVMIINNHAKATVDGNLAASGNYAGAMFHLSHYTYNDSELNILSSAKILANSSRSNEIVNNQEVLYPDNNPNRVNIESGAVVGFMADDKPEYYKFIGDFVSADKDRFYITATNITDICDVKQIMSAGVEAESFFRYDDRSAPSSGGQYEALLQGYDDVIRDSSYQGINLLTGGERTIGFNETRSHQFTVSGKDMSAAALGLEAGEWQTQGEIAESLNRIASALESIRGFQAELGTHYGIIRTRQDFTEALADVLESGAEELVLADMNEATAEYLTLQTRQYLAVNALSLAAQSSRGILRLF